MTACFRAAVDIQEDVGWVCVCLCFGLVAKVVYLGKLGDRDILVSGSESYLLSLLAMIKCSICSYQCDN